MNALRFSFPDENLVDISLTFKDINHVSVPAPNKALQPFHIKIVEQRLTK